MLYQIDKNNYDDADINFIKGQLTIRPSTNYSGLSESFNMYIEKDNMLQIPKFYSIEKFGLKYENTCQGTNIITTFIIELKAEQKKILPYILEEYQKKGGGILSLSCGYGKTIIALYFIALLKKKTLIIVHRDFLITHWTEKINMCLENIKIGTIQGQTINIDKCDIVIAMVQTLSSNDYPDNFFNSFGHVIIDECHRVSSSVFSKILFKIQNNYILGLSATPDRKDGLTQVLNWHIGNVIKIPFLNTNQYAKQDTKIDIYVKRYILNFSEKYKNHTELNKERLVQNNVSKIISYNLRTEIIVNTVISEYNLCNDRHFLILSDRHTHLEQLYKEFKKQKFDSVIIYIGGMKETVFNKCKSTSIILSTYSMSTEGLDIPSLNCLVLASPKIEITQAIGRIVRPKINNVPLLIIDYVDLLNVFMNESKKRLKIYKNNSYYISDYIYDPNNNIFNKDKNVNEDYSMFNVQIKKNEDIIDSLFNSFDLK